MAENDNTGAPGVGEDMTTRVAILLFEARLTVECAIAGLNTLARQYASEPLNSEIKAVQAYATQSAEAFEALAIALNEHFGFTVARQ